jgi:FlaA1/EpsC-like NDP-sugar epimerase
VHKKPVMIDLDDPKVQQTLMGRPVCDELTRSEREAYRGRRVLVTGAGGSVGSELVRRLAACGPDSVTLLDQSECHLFYIERELRSRWPLVKVHAVLGDVTRPRVMRAACESSTPDVVFHAAAYKHVTMLERDVCAGVLANVIGTVSAAECAREAGARFVLISTDKAVNPRAVMGATKRLAELVTLARFDRTFRPVVVRFGNVLGSSGSVVELMARSIQNGEPLTITHPDATRYFMTVGEAATLVLRADLMRLGGEICWLDMGTPIRIVDLAKRLLALGKSLGMPPVPLSMIGLRPGEKLDEDLTLQGMDLSRTDHARIWIARHAGVNPAAMRRIVRSLRADLLQGDGLAALTDLCAAVPEYIPSDEARRAAGAVTLNAALVFDDGPRALVA